MCLTIINKNNVPISKFMKFLVSRIQNYLVDNIDNRHLARFQNFIDNNRGSFETGLNKLPSVRSLLLSCIFNLKSIQEGTDHIVLVDTTAHVAGLSISVEQFARFVNDGNAQVAGYPLFSNAFKYFASNLEGYYNCYCTGVS